MTTDDVERIAAEEEAAFLEVMAALDAVKAAETALEQARKKHTKAQAAAIRAHLQEQSR